MGRFKLSVTAPADIDGLSLEALKALVLQLLSKSADQDRLIAALREENTRLKGLNGRPRIKPSGMEKAREPKLSGKRGKHRRRGKLAPRVAIEDRVIKAQVPPGSRFKGYETFVVQDIVLNAAAIRYQRERWITPEGTMVLAALPAGVNGHFGPELHRFVLMQYHQGQVTVPRPVAQLRGIGVAISKRQTMRLLIAGQDGFFAENRDVLRAGLQSAAWVSVDDTSARHAAKNGFCTQIGNDDFAWFGTRTSKSRLNFLDLLRAGFTDYVINQAALDYMRGRDLPGPVITQLATHQQTRFADQAAWQAHLDQLGISALRLTPDPICIATEGAPWGSVQAHGLLREMVIVSDRACPCEGGGRPVRRRPPRAMLGACGTAGAQAGHLHRSAAHRAAAHARIHLAVLGTHCAAPWPTACTLRPHLPSTHRLRHARPLAGAVARQQARVAEGIRSARDTASHQWLRAGLVETDFWQRLANPPANSGLRLRPS